jgi:hypothetical protein
MQVTDYTQAITSVEFSQFKIRYDDEEEKKSDNQHASLLASSHVNGSVKVYKFNSYDDLKSKHKDCRPDL